MITGQWMDLAININTEMDKDWENDTGQVMEPATVAMDLTMEQDTVLEIAKTSNTNN